MSSVTDCNFKYLSISLIKLHRRQKRSKERAPPPKKRKKKRNEFKIEIECSQGKFHSQFPLFEVRFFPITDQLRDFIDQDLLRGRRINNETLFQDRMSLHRPILPSPLLENSFFLPLLPSIDKWRRREAPDPLGEEGRAGRGKARDGHSSLCIGSCHLRAPLFSFLSPVPAR